MLDRMPALLFRGFLKALERGAVDTSHRAPIEITNDSRVANAHLSDSELSRAARHAGEVYRGLGVLVGLMGALVVLLALLPDALRLGDAAKTVLSYAKFALMALILVLLFVVRRYELRSRWIQLRLLNESRRYAALESALSDASDSGAGAAGALAHRLRDALEGPTGQIAYNEGRAHAYEGIEAFVKQITYAGFGLSMLAAAASVVLAHLSVKAPWLLLLTAFVPAAVAALHGIVGFLRLPELVVQHERMAARLAHWLASIPPDLATPGATQQLIQVAESALADLRQGDRVWTTVVRKAVVLPA